MALALTQAAALSSPSTTTLPGTLAARSAVLTLPSSTSRLPMIGSSTLTSAVLSTAAKSSISSLVRL